jgi:hypothetical protein
VFHNLGKSTRGNLMNCSSLTKGMYSKLSSLRIVLVFVFLLTPIKELKKWWTKNYNLRQGDVNDPPQGQDGLAKETKNKIFCAHIRC